MTVTGTTSLEGDAEDVTSSVVNTTDPLGIIIEDWEVVTDGGDVVTNGGEVVTDGGVVVTVTITEVFGGEGWEDGTCVFPPPTQVAKSVWVGKLWTTGTVAKSVTWTVVCPPGIVLT